MSGSITRVIRADPKRRGLLFVGTESGVRVSFDDGDHWQSLKVDMPDTPCWDLTIKDNDLIVGTYGRGIWAETGPRPFRPWGCAGVAFHARIEALDRA